MLYEMSPAHSHWAVGLSWAAAAPPAHRPLHPPLLCRFTLVSSEQISQCSVPVVPALCGTLVQIHLAAWIFFVFSVVG